jgi:hypothetical protein
MRRLILLCFAALLLSPRLAAAGPSDVQRCDGTRLRALATLTKKRLLCQAQAVKSGAAVSSECLNTVGAAFARSVNRAQKGTCDGTWDAAAINLAAQDLLAPLHAALGSGPSRCAAKQLKAAGLRAAEALRAWGDYRGDLDLAAVRGAMQKAADRLAKRLARAGQLDDCVATDDPLEIEHQGNAVVQGLVLAHAPPAATTEARTATAAGGRLSYTAGIAIDVPPKAFLNGQTATLTLTSSSSADSTALALVAGHPLAAAEVSPGAFNITLAAADPAPLLPLSVSVPLPPGAATDVDWTWQILSTNPASLQRASLPCEWTLPRGRFELIGGMLRNAFPPVFFSDRCGRIAVPLPYHCHNECDVTGYVVNGVGAPIYDARLACSGCSATFEGGGLNSVIVPAGTSQVRVYTSCGSALIPLPGGATCQASGNVCGRIEGNFTADFSACIGNFAGSWLGTFRSVQDPLNIFGDFRASITQSGATIVGVGAVDISVFGVELAGSMTGTASGSNVAVGLAFGPMPGQEITFHGQMTSNPARIIGTYENSLDSGTWEAYRQ